MSRQDVLPAVSTNLRRQLLWYFGVLGLVYVGTLLLFRPADGQEPSGWLFAAIMYAPAAGALAAHFAAGGSIQWGRLNWWAVAALLPVVLVLVIYLVAAAMGWIEQIPGVLRAALVASPMALVLSGLTAFGEEVGWRGFLWPTLRKRYGFYAVSAIVLLVWFLYHVPIVLLGWYGSLSGLPAFTVAIVGFGLFIGVLTDRARAVWPSIVGHAAWNGMVAQSFQGSVGTYEGPAFTGDAALLGEFGWLAALGMLVLGVASAVWHTRSGHGGKT